MSVAFLQVIEFRRSQTGAGRFTEPPLQGLDTPHSMTPESPESLNRVSR
jgi:hypothetical protein